MSRRLLLHTLAAALAWALFGFYWWLVSRRRVTSETMQALQLLVLIVAGIWAATTLWIHHNQRRFGGRPDRRQRRTSRLELSPQDSLGRRVEVRGDVDLRTAPYVRITIDAETGEKCFEAFRRPPERHETALDEPSSTVGGAA